MAAVQRFVQEPPKVPTTKGLLIRALRDALHEAEMALDHTASPQDRRLAQIAVRKALDLPSVHEDN